MRRMINRADCAINSSSEQLIKQATTVLPIRSRQFQQSNNCENKNNNAAAVNTKWLIIHF